MSSNFQIHDTHSISLSRGEYLLDTNIKNPYAFVHAPIPHTHIESTASHLFFNHYGGFHEIV